MKQRNVLVGDVTVTYPNESAAHAAAMEGLRQYFPGCELSFITSYDGKGTDIYVLDPDPKNIRIAYSLREEGV
jgi:hypothetical protein